MGTTKDGGCRPNWEELNKASQDIHFKSQLSELIFHDDAFKFTSPPESVLCCPPHHSPLSQKGIFRPLLPHSQHYLLLHGTAQVTSIPAGSPWWLPHTLPRPLLCCVWDDDHKARPPCSCSNSLSPRESGGLSLCRTFNVESALCSGGLFQLSGI